MTEGVSESATAAPDRMPNTLAVTNAFMVHASLALHELGFRGTSVPAHADGWLRLYASKDQSGYACLRVSERRAAEHFSKGTLPDFLRRQAGFVDRLWDTGYRRKLPAQAAI